MTVEKGAWCLCGVVDDRGDGTCGNCGLGLMTEDDVEEDRTVLAELAEAVANALADRPQRCGHASSPMCCPDENFPTLAAFFDPDEDATTCGVDEGYGRCSRPAGHAQDGTHAVLIGGGSDPVSDPALWFAFGEAVDPGFRSTRIESFGYWGEGDYTCGHPNHGTADHDCAPFRSDEFKPGQVESFGPDGGDA